MGGLAIISWALLAAAVPVSALSIPTGYTTTLFLDQFNGAAGSKPDPTRWAIDLGTQYAGGPAQWGTGEVETYTANSANVQLTGAGTLRITPQKATNGGAWTSGRIETLAKWDFACKSGGKMLMQARLQLGANQPSQQLGIWPAVWTLGSAFRSNRWSWPAIGEIDIMETVNGLTTVWQSDHCGVNPGGPCHEPNGIQSSATVSRGTWHVFGVQIDRTNSNWRNQKVSWYIDGVLVSSVTGASVNNQTDWGHLTADPKFMLLNVAVGGAFPNGVSGKYTPTAATLGGTGSSMEVDYVAVYST